MDFLTQRATEQSYELLAHLEHVLLYDYRRTRQIAEDEKDRFGCRSVAKDLMRTIETFRDKVNADQQFVRYKTLVGFESVFPPHWEDEEFDFGEVEKFRHERAGEYIDAISEAAEDEWYRVVERCASTKSDDMATFPVFGEFLCRLAKTKPGVATRFLGRADDNVLNFLPAFLNGLKESGSDEEYRAVLTRYLAGGKHLVAIARHFRKTGTVSSDSIKEVLKRAVAASDDIAVIEVWFSRSKDMNRKSTLVEDVFVPAIKYLIGRKDARWVHGAWFLGKTFFPVLSADHANLVLDSLVSLPRIEYHAERILVYIAGPHPKAVWGFFGRRLAEKREEKEESYEAFPYQFHGLEQPLAMNVKLAIGSVRSLFRAGDTLLRFDGGRLLSTVFPAFPEPFAQKLSDMAANGSDEDVGFVLGILQNYKGEAATHPVLKALVNRLSEDDPRLAQVDISLQNTGVVGGEFGFVEAFREKKAVMASWLDDPMPRVKGFAAEYIRRLDQRIASEQRSAEQMKEQRKRDFESDDMIDRLRG